MSKGSRVRATLGVKRAKAGRVIAVGKDVLAGIGSHPALFPAPPVDMATLEDQIAATDKYHVDARRRDLGAAARRDELRDVLYTSLETLCAFVQALCDRNPEQAVSLIQASGFKVCKDTSPVKPPLRIRQGHQPGMVFLDAYVALAVQGSGARFFNWEYRVGDTWTAAPSTPIGNTVISGLPVLTEVAFRFSVTTRQGTGAWSQERSFVVH